MNKEKGNMLVKLGAKLECKCGSNKFEVYEIKKDEDGEIVGHTFKCLNCSRWHHK